MQKLIRVYPDSYTHNRVSELNQLLSDGWFVVSITKSREDKYGGVINDYII